MQFTLDMWEGKILAQEARVGKASPKYVQYCIAQDNDLQLFFFRIRPGGSSLAHVLFLPPPHPHIRIRANGRQDTASMLTVLVHEPGACQLSCPFFGSCLLFDLYESLSQSRSFRRRAKRAPEKRPFLKEKQVRLGLNRKTPGPWLGRLVYFPCSRVSLPGRSPCLRYRSGLNARGPSQSSEINPTHVQSDLLVAFHLLLRSVFVKLTPVPWGPWFDQWVKLVPFRSDSPWPSTPCSFSWKEAAVIGGGEGTKGRGEKDKAAGGSQACVGLFMDIG